MKPPGGAVRALGLLLLLSSAQASAAQFVVETTADSGPGSLRQAILNANANPGSTIVFSIGSGLQTIQPATELPLLISGTIDGTTQPGYGLGLPPPPMIQIDGSLLPPSSDCLKLGNGSAAVVVEALLVNRCPHAGIRTAGSVTLRRSWIGVDANGVTPRPNQIGIHVSTSGATIGGNSENSGIPPNVISGNSAIGILMNAGATVTGNYIGTSPNLTVAVPNLVAGVSVENTSNVEVGGGLANYISGNGDSGVLIRSSSIVGIRGNVIGSSDGFQPVGTQRVGIRVENSSDALIGGLPTQNNISFNTDVGVAIDSASQRVQLTQNSIYSNGFGIDLDFVAKPAQSRVTPNDPLDADVGANLLQNFPVVEVAFAEGATTTVRGSLHSKPGSTYRIEIFSAGACNGSGYGEGSTFAGSTQVHTDAQGNASFAEVVNYQLFGGAVSATATDESGNTSEFSACKIVTEPPAQKFFTLTPCRVRDTREAGGPLNGATGPSSRRFISLAGVCGIPVTARSVSANITVAEPTAVGHLMVFAPDDFNPPTASLINFTVGRTRANNALLKLSTDTFRTIQVQNVSLGSVHVILDVNGYFE